MSLAHVNTRVEVASVATSTTIVSPAANHTAGNGLIALIDVSYGAGTVTGIANTAGDTWTKLGTVDDATVFNHLEIWYTSNTNGNASDVVTATLSLTTTYRMMAVHEISGQNKAGMGGSVVSASGTGTAISSGTVTVTAAQEGIFAILGANGDPYTGGTGYTLTHVTPDGIHYYYADEWHIVQASEAATVTANASSSWVILAGSFKAAPNLFRPPELVGLGAGGPFFQNPLD